MGECSRDDQAAQGRSRKGIEMKSGRLMFAALMLCAVIGAALLAPLASADVTESEDVTVQTPSNPRLRLAQVGGSEADRSWDLTGNHEAFSLRDQTAATTPFRVESETPDDTLVLGRTGGRVGIGVPDPDAHIGALQIDSYGEARVLYTDPAPAVDSHWTAGIPAFEDAFGIGPSGVPPTLKLLPWGDAEVVGSVSEAANTGTVSDVEGVDDEAILAKLKSLPIQSWRFEGAPQDDRHLGPLADVFGPTFGLGHDVRHISPADVAGVSLAAVQGLAKHDAEVEASARQASDLAASLADRTSSLEAKNAALESRAGSLEGSVGGLAKQLAALRKQVRKLAKK
jgi:hypothetical protein